MILSATGKILTPITLEFANVLIWLPLCRLSIAAHENVMLGAQHTLQPKSWDTHVLANCFSGLGGLHLFYFGLINHSKIQTSYPH